MSMLACMCARNLLVCGVNDTHTRRKTFDSVDVCVYVYIYVYIPTPIHMHVVHICVYEHAFKDPYTCKHDLRHAAAGMTMWPPSEEKNGIAWHANHAFESM